MSTNESPKAADLRRIFGGPRGQAIAKLAQPAWGDYVDKGTRSDRFVYLESDDFLTLVCGEHEDRNAHLALPYGLQYTHGTGLKLRLVLPQGLSERTLARSAWLASGTVEVWTHNGRSATFQKPRTRAQVLRDTSSAPVRMSPAPHLSTTGSPAFDDLLAWLADDSGPHRLDAAHAVSYRAWQHGGRVVLKFSRVRGGADITITAGIAGKTIPPRARATAYRASKLTAEEFEAITARVDAACRIHARGGSRPDRDPEGWLQSLLRSRPGLVGLEQPVLREVPVWRPGSVSAKGVPTDAGRIDLLGLDTLGSMLLVETKLGPDPDLAFQGLDYYIWLSQDANREHVGQVLDAASSAPITLAYVVGAKEPKVSLRSKKGERPFLHPAFRPCVQAFADDVDWRVAFVSDWYRDHGGHTKVTWEPRRS